MNENIVQREPNKDPLSLLVSPNRACSILDISHTTLWRLTKNDKNFPRALRLTGKKTVFRYRDLVTWVNALNENLEKNAITGRELLKNEQ